MNFSWGFELSARSRLTHAQGKSRCKAKLNTQVSPLFFGEAGRQLGHWDPPAMSAGPGF